MSETQSQSESTQSKSGQHKNVLVLHLPGMNQPLYIALDEASAETIQPVLPELMAVGDTRLLHTSDGGQFVVNFRHVATAHLSTLPSNGHVYGSISRPAGFRP